MNRPKKVPRVETRDGFSVIYPEGDLKIGHRNLHELVPPVLATSTHGIILDLSSVGVVDSDSLRSLLIVQAEALSQRKMFAVSGASARLKVFFAITDVGDAVAGFETADEAVDTLSGMTFEQFMQKQPITQGWAKTSG